MLQLGYPLQDTVDINGEVYNLDLSFDNVLRLLDMLDDKELNDSIKVILGLKMLLDTEFDYELEEQSKIFIELFKSIFSEDVEEIEDLDIEGNPMPSIKNDKVYSIKEDAEYIFASFYQDYGIDLIEQQGKLHWSKFKAMLGGLRSDTQFKEIINIRTMDLPQGKGSNKEREQIKKLKRQYALKEGD